MVRGKYSIPRGRKRELERSPTKARQTPSRVKIKICDCTLSTWDKEVNSKQLGQRSLPPALLVAAFNGFFLGGFACCLQLSSADFSCACFLQLPGDSNSILSSLSQLHALACQGHTASSPRLPPEMWVEASLIPQLLHFVCL